MANTNAVEEHSIDKKDYNVCRTDCGKNKKQEEEEVSSKVKVQWLKSSGKVVPSDRDLIKEKATARSTSHVTKVEENNNSVEEQEENKSPTKITEDSVGKIEQNKTEYHERGETTTMDTEEQDTVTEARLRAQRRWRMGLLKRSKLGGIGQDVTGLFPDYFPSSIATDKNEDDDILTSLKESKQRHRAKLLKQNSIDKIDRELGDRETKLIAGSWLQIYS